MKTFIINLNRSPERWAHMRELFEPTSLDTLRIEAVDGRTLVLPNADFNAAAFRRFHGRRTNVFEVACYLSHLRAMDQFLASGEGFGMICEDDLVLRPGFEAVLADGMRWTGVWDILRLTGLSAGRPLKVADLSQGYALNVCLSRLKGAGAYVLSRRAAQRLRAGLTPMFLPFDHAIDREWVYGLRALYVTPFPVSQRDVRFPSSIQKPEQKLGPVRRLLTTYPYQAANEVSRYAHRTARGLRLRRAGTGPDRIATGKDTQG